MIIDVSGVTEIRTPADTDLSDLTRSRITGNPWWSEDGESLEIPFDVEPSPTEQAAIRRRLLSADAAEESLVNLLLAARKALATDDTPTGRILRVLVNDRLRQAKEA